VLGQVLIFLSQHKFRLKYLALFKYRVFDTNAVIRDISIMIKAVSID
jgi:hypothetical protein